MPSSVIRSFRYDRARNELLVTFQSGKRYRYEQVPVELYESMKNAFSKGEFFNTHVRDRFSFQRDESC